MIYVYIYQTIFIVHLTLGLEWRSVLNDQNSIQKNHGSTSGHLQTQRFLKKGDIKHFLK